jgi:hypothetical protein
MNEECTESGRRTAICNWQHCGKKMSISYNGGTTNLIDHLVSTHGFHRTPLKPPREDASDSDSLNSSNSKESDGSRWKDSKGGVDSDKETEVYIRSDKDYDYWGPINNPRLPDPYVSYTAIRDLHSQSLYRTHTKVDMKGSDKWIILCLASQKLSQNSPKIKPEKEIKEIVAFLMNTDTKDIYKESLSKLKYLKGPLSADLKRDAHNAIDHLPDWINHQNNLDNGKKRPREAGITATQVLVKKELTPESQNAEEEKKIERFTSPDRKRQKKPLIDTSRDTHLSPRLSPNEITAPMITPTPPLATGSNRAKLSPHTTTNTTKFTSVFIPPLLLKKRTVTIAKPEPPQPLENPKMF